MGKGCQRKGTNVKLFYRKGIALEGCLLKGRVGRLKRRCGCVILSVKLFYSMTTIRSAITFNMRPVLA